MDQAMDARPRVEAALREMVHRRAAQRLGQLSRPPRPRAAAHEGRAHLGGRARRQPCPDLLGALPRGQPLRGGAAERRREEGRHRHHLHADDPRGGRRDPRLRPYRRPALRRVRRLFAGIAARPYQRREVARPHHRGWWLPARRRRRAQAQRGRGDQGVPERADGDRRPSHEAGRPVDHGAGRLVGGLHPGRARAMRARADGRRGHAVPPLHVRLYRQAKGHRPHDRRLPHGRHHHHEVHLRPARGRHVLVHRGHRLGHRALVRGLWPAVERRLRGHVRGNPRLARQGSLLAHHREVRRHDPLYGAHGHSHVRPLGGTVSEGL